MKILDIVSGLAFVAVSFVLGTFFMSLLSSYEVSIFIVVPLMFVFLLLPALALESIDRKLSNRYFVYSAFNTVLFIVLIIIVNRFLLPLVSIPSDKVVEYRWYGILIASILPTIICIVINDKAKTIYNEKKGKQSNE